MSTVTPSPMSSASTGPTRAPIGPPRGQPSALPGGAGPSGFASIDPIRLLRRYWMLLAASAIIGGVVGVAGHFALLRLYPLYTAQALFLCQEKPGTTTETRTEGISQADFDRFMGTQSNQMTSVAVLQAALKNTELLNTKWARQFVVNGNFQAEKALAKLQDKITARTVNQTTLIRLSMTWRDPNDVRAIVAAVSDAYIQNLRNSESAQSADRRQVLDARRNDINERIAILNRNRDQILRDGKVTSLKEGADAAAMQETKISENLVEARQQGAQMKALLERLRNSAADNAVIPYPEDMREQAKMDPVVQDLTRQITQLKVDEQSLLGQGYRENHPAMIAVRKRIQAATSEMESQTNTVLQRLYDSRVEELAKSVESNAAREAKLLADLAEVSTRKQDLVSLLLKVENIESQIQQLTDELTVVTKARQELEALSTYSVFDRVRLWSPAQKPNEVTFPKLAVMLPLGVLLFVGLTATVVLLRELLDQRVKGPADVAMIPRLRVLGMIPDAAEDPSRPGSVETAFRDTPGGVVTESFRQIRAPLVNRLDAEDLRTVLVLGGMPGSGSTTVVANLGIACAGADEKVLLIDANFRRPALHRVLGVAEAGTGPGLADCLAGQANFADTIHPTNVPNLYVMPAGTANNRMSPERLSSESLKRVLAEAASGYTRVFIDAPPAIVSGDGMAIANRCDAVVMVVRALNEKRGLVNRIRTQLAGARAELLGVIVNGVKSSAGGYFKRNIQATHEYQNAGRE